MMRSFRAFTATLLLITPLLASCADITEPIDTRPAVERQDGLIGGLLGGVVGLVGGVVNGLLGILIGGDDANGEEATKWIGSGGGTLTTGAYTLVVPSGAVTTSTLFGVRPANNGTYSIDLSATRKGLFRSINVGAQGFSRPVTVTVSYAGADNLKDPLRLVIVYVTVDGRTVPQSTSIDLGEKTVSSSLDHFSKYALVQN